MSWHVGVSDWPSMTFVQNHQDNTKLVLLVFLELERTEAKCQGTEIRNTSGAGTVNQPGLNVYLTALTPSHTQASRFSVGGGAM